MRVPAWLLRHRVRIEPYDGDSAYGPTYRDPVEVRALVAEANKVTRDRQGVEVTSTAQIIAEPGLDCPPESRITLPSSRVTRAISVAQHTAPGLPTPDCAEVMCE
ncbi:head-to-tail stopper [Streptomyces phage Picard]|uniref:Head-to-tail stopper n=1 Tax=Streptomyces phage Picard TaxID=1920311 RepID=A0A1J0MC23_9CAUD|nr:head-tail connector protein [Streptomyces phage Picard]APD18541.1 head-to-tail stopper [Streptomyces phage Picard]